jgi:hypothetical protein
VEITYLLLAVTKTIRDDPQIAIQIVDGALANLSVALG